MALAKTAKFAKLMIFLDYLAKTIKFTKSTTFREGLAKTIKIIWKIDDFHHDLAIHNTCISTDC